MSVTPYQLIFLVIEQWFNRRVTRHKPLCLLVLNVMLPTEANVDEALVIL